jgi:hypothetical protein
LTGVLGTSHIDLYVPSEVTGTTRFYGSADVLNRDVADARVWGGVHSRTADVAGCRAGTHVAAWALDHYFQPVAEDGTQPSLPTRTAEQDRRAEPRCDDSD